MKGIIIYGNPIGINSRATYCDYIKDAYFDFKQDDSKIITRCLGGDASEKSMATCNKDDTIYFRLWKINKLSYASDLHVYAVRNLECIPYLPPMRWDLFKKGRKIIRVTPENFGEAMARIRANVALIYGGYGWERVIKNNFNKQHGFIRVHAIAKDTGYASLEFMEPEDLVKKQLADPTVYSSNKIVDWEDVR